MNAAENIPMADRKFELPGIQDLSKDQEDVRALPMTGQHLIVGGPGTGKSILALLRARRLKQEELPYVFLVYNHLLNESSRQLFGGLKSKQWQSWFKKIYKDIFDKDVPKLSPEGKSTWPEIDWPKVQAEVGNAASDISVNPQNLVLVIDEGQDMPPQFYSTLINLGYENFFVMADQNQQIKMDLNSSREDIRLALGLETDEVIELKENYRNKYSVARLARAFYTGDPASPPPDLPAITRRSVEVPLCYEYEHFDILIKRILKTADRDSSKLIGIITYNNKDRLIYYNGLKNINCELDHAKPKINTYSSNERNDIHFDQGGLMVINAQACKGLEFDIVFIADINNFWCSEQNKDNMKRLFYVMVARAIDRVFLLKQSGEHCSIESILPKDPSILEIK